MEATELYQEIQDLQKLVIQIAKREPLSIKKLADVYYKVFKETFAIGCKSCPTKAYGKLQQISLQTLNAMQNQKFKLKKQALINYPAFSGQHYTSHNITDDKAVQMIKDFPSLIDHFETYPTNEDGSVNLEIPKEPETAQPGGKDKAKKDEQKEQGNDPGKTDAEIKNEAENK